MPNFLDFQRRQARVTAFLIGTYAGVVGALLIAALVGVGVDAWRAREDERRLTAIRAEIINEAAECKAIVERLGGTEYAQVLELVRQREGR